MQKDAAEPAPKRRKTIPKPRTTEYLDLRSPFPDACGTDQKGQLETLMKLLHKKKKIVVIAGAGISVNAGIPDFRSSDGLFNTLRTAKNSGKDLFDASVYKDDGLTSSFHDMVRTLHGMSAKAAPTEFHQLLAALATEGRLLRLYSQNVDCIETRLEPLKTAVPLQAKGPWPQTIQVHGGLENMTCSKCGWVGPLEPERFVGAEPPDCMECKEMETVRGIAGKRSLGVGKLRPRIVLYNEFHPDAEAIGAVTEADIRARPDALIVVGTSLKVPGVKRIVQEMCKTVRSFRGGLSVWVNEQDPPSAKDYSFDLVVRGDCENVARLAKLPRWDSESESSEESFVEIEPGDARLANQVEVHIPTQAPNPLPSPSLSPDPHVPKSKKRTAAAAGLDKPPAVKKPRAKKEPKKKPGAIKAAFKSVKTTPSSTPVKAAAKPPAKAAARAPAKPRAAGTRKAPVRKLAAAAAAVAAASAAAAAASATIVPTPPETGIVPLMQETMAQLEQTAHIGQPLKMEQPIYMEQHPVPIQEDMEQPFRAFQRLSISPPPTTPSPTLIPVSSLLN